MKNNEIPSTLSRFAASRIGWISTFVPGLAFGRIRAMKGQTPEQRTEARILRMWEARSSEFRSFFSLFAVMPFLGGFAIMGGINIESPIVVAVLMTTCAVVSLGWIIAGAATSSAMDKVTSQEKPVFLSNTRDAKDTNELHRFILMEEKFAEAGFTHNEMKRMSAVMLALSVARDAGVSTTLPDDVSALFERARGTGVPLLTASYPEAEDLLLTLRSAGVEVASS